MAHYLVTGGCGFIGSHLCDALVAAGHRVTVLDNLSTGRLANLNPAARLIIGDVQNPETVRRAMADVDGCFHLAAIASVERAREAWLATHGANQTATITVLDAARATATRSAVPVVYASSAAVYGDAKVMPIPEYAPQEPLGAYGADKLGSELHARVASVVHGVPTMGFRFFNVYGPRQDPSSPYSGVISIFADRISRSLPVTVYGDGQQVRDFIHVSDIVRFLVTGMEGIGAEPKVYNACTGRPTSVLELARTVATLANVSVDIQMAPARKGEIRVSIGDGRRAAQELGVRARVSLVDGLATLPAIASARVDQAA